MTAEIAAQERAFQPKDVLIAYQQTLARIEGNPETRADQEAGVEPMSAEEEAFAAAIKGTAVEHDLMLYFDHFLKEDSEAHRLLGHPQPLTLQDQGLVLLNILVEPTHGFYGTREWTQLALL